MMNIAQFRKNYPVYNYLSDEDLSHKLYERFYQNKISRDEFDKKFQPQKYSPLQKAKHVGREAFDWALLGLGDVAAGGINTIQNDTARVLYDNSVKNKAQAMANYLFHLTPMGFAHAINADEGKYGRAEFVQGQHDFNEKHPVLSAIGAGVGSALTGGFGSGKNALKGAGMTLKKMTKQGLKEGSKWGGVYGATEGLTSEPKHFAPLQALRGMFAGGMVGGATGVGAAGVTRAGEILKKAVKNRIGAYRNRNYNAVMHAAGGEENIQNAIMSDIALLDEADENLIRLAEQAKLTKPEAAQVFRQYAEERLAKQHNILNHTIDEHFGNQGFSQRMEKMDLARQAEDGPLYQQAIYGKDGKGVRLEGLSLNRDELDYIEQVYKTTGFKSAVHGKPYNDMRVLDYAKQLMDSDISKFIRNEENTRAANQTAIKNNFLAKIDKLNPIYKRARGVFEKYERLKDAMKKGKKINTGSTSERQFDLDGMSAAEKEHYLYGAREKLLENFNHFKSGKGNLPKKVFDIDTMRRLKMLPLKNYDRLKNTIQKEVRAAENLNRLLGGSQTAEREKAKIQDLMNPKGMLWQRTLEKVNNLIRTNPTEIAKMMTDPGYLATQRYLAMQRDLANTAKPVGKIFFDLQRSASPFIVKGESPLILNGDSWRHIKKSPDWRTFDALQHVEEINKKGRAKVGVGNYKERNDDYEKWDYKMAPIQTPQGKKKMLLTIGKEKTGRRVLHNINPDVDQYNKKKEAFSGVLKTPLKTSIIPLATTTGIHGGKTHSDVNEDVLVKTPSAMPATLTRASVSNGLGGDNPRAKETSYGQHQTPVFPQGKTNYTDAPTLHQQMVVPPTMRGPADEVKPFMRSGLQFRGKGSINSITEKFAKSKGAKKNKEFNMRDFLILLQRPYNLGQQGAIGGKNLNKGDE